MSFKAGKNNIADLNLLAIDARRKSRVGHETGTVWGCFIRLKSHAENAKYNFEEVIAVDNSRKNQSEFARGKKEFATEVNGLKSLPAGLVVWAILRADGFLYFNAYSAPVDSYTNDDGQDMIVVTVPKNDTAVQKIPVIVNGKTILVNMASGGGGGANLPDPEEGKLLRWKNGVLINDYDRLC